MVTLGTDSHKQSRALVAVEQNGSQLGEGRVRIQRRLRWHVQGVGPGMQIAGGGLARRVMLKEVDRRLEAHQGVVSEIARDLVERLTELMMSVNRLQRRIEVLAAELAP